MCVCVCVCVCACVYIFQYITHVHFYKEKYVDANLDASENAISVYEPSSEVLTSQRQIPE